MRYIVTGGADFIGSNLADTAAPRRCSCSVSNETSHLSQHHDVVIIDTPATGANQEVPDGCVDSLSFRYLPREN